MIVRTRALSLVVWSVAAVALVAGLRVSGLADSIPAPASAAEEAPSDTAASADTAKGAAEKAEDAPKAKAARAPDLKRGQAVYLKNCVECHRANGAGGVKPLAAGNPAPNFRDPVYWKEKSDADLLRATTEGIPRSGMVAWKGTLTPEQIQDVVAFVRKRFEPRRKTGDEAAAEAKAETGKENGEESKETEESDPGESDDDL